SDGAGRCDSDREIALLDDISEAVMNTIKWSDEVALAKRSFPEIQDEIQDEIDKLRASCLTGNSFVPGTLVLLADGSTKPIEEVELGDRVLATDPDTGESEPQKVVATI